MQQLQCFCSNTGNSGNIAVPLVLLQPVTAPRLRWLQLTPHRPAGPPAEPGPDRTVTRHAAAIWPFLKPPSASQSAPVLVKFMADHPALLSPVSGLCSAPFDRSVALRDRPSTIDLTVIRP